VKNNTLKYKFKQSGLTLLELVLVTSLILLGVIIGIQQYQKTVLNRHVAQIKNSVRMLTSALEQYYTTNCYWFLTGYLSYPIPLTSNPTPPGLPNSSSTLQNYIVEPNLIDNFYSIQHGLNAYTYTIDTRGDFPIIRISTRFNVSTSMLHILAGLLKPTSQNASTFTWSANPNNTYLTSATLNSNLSYLQSLSMNFTDVSSRQISYQYVASGPNEQTNLCIYWQQPKYRCTVTKDNTRCDYQNKPS
jgi:type II secretory pathway pseudopilin PulG